MACPDSVLIDKNLEFDITVHDPEDGQIVDADSVPTYKVYRYSNKSLVTSGTMTKFDATENGLYSESLLCDSNDFEDGETYLVLIKAAVNGVTGGITYGFTAHTEITAPIGYPVVIQGFDALSGKNVQISGRYI